MNTDSISNTMRSAIIVLVIVAIAIGYILGSQLTTFSNAGLEHMAGWQLDRYVRGVADTFTLSGDVDYVLRSVCYGQSDLDADVNTVRERASSTAVINDTNYLASYQTLLRLVDQVGGCDTYRSTPGNEPVSANDGGNIFGLLFGVLLIAAVLGGAFYYLRNRSDDDGESDSNEEVETQTAEKRRGLRERFAPAATPQQAQRPAAAAAPSSSDPTPIGGFTTTYTRGDDSFDKSFIIENANGDFLGECGVSISDTVGADDGMRNVTAFEIWLFDKNDTHTVTKVIMSEHAYHDQATRAKLASRGEPVLAHFDDTIALETNSLIINAEIAEIEYSDMPPGSGIFDRFTADLSAWVKADNERQSDSNASEMLNF